MRTSGAACLVKEGEVHNLPSTQQELGLQSRGVNQTLILLRLLRPSGGVEDGQQENTMMSGPHRR